MQIQSEEEPYSLTAEELADHLGVQWTSAMLDIGARSDSLTVTVAEIENGNIQRFTGSNERRGFELPPEIRLTVLHERVKSENAHRYTVRLGELMTFSSTSDLLFEKGQQVFVNKSLSMNEDGYVVILYALKAEGHAPKKFVNTPSSTDPKKAYRALALRITTEDP